MADAKIINTGIQNVTSSEPKAEIHGTVIQPEVETVKVQEGNGKITKPDAENKDLNSEGLSADVALGRSGGAQLAYFLFQKYEKELRVKTEEFYSHLENQRDSYQAQIDSQRESFQKQLSDQRASY